jgi:hypothetical protein
MSGTEMYEAPMGNSDTDGPEHKSRPVESPAEKYRADVDDDRIDMRDNAKIGRDLLHVDEKKRCDNKQAARQEKGNRPHQIFQAFAAMVVFTLIPHFHSPDVCYYG